MAAPIIAAAITAGAGLIGGLFQAKAQATAQKKNALEEARRRKQLLEQQNTVGKVNTLQNVVEGFRKTLTGG